MPRAIWLFLLAAACGSVTVTPPDAPPADDAGETPDAPEVPDAAEPAPALATALDCGAPATAGGLRPGSDLQRVDIDLAAFPDARCNDGTAGTYYMRPAATAQGSKRWVIQLQGGGSCNSPDDCAKRWCSVDTNYGMTQMSSTISPSVGIPADGILYRGTAVANPLADANHIYVHYCSSDAWAGATGPLDVDALHPVSGNPIRYRIDFRGRDILDAVIATLRQDGSAPPSYTLGSEPIAMPDLDSASNVLLAGASAGGAGTIQNADRVNATLHASNPSVDFTVLIDSIFAPSGEKLDWSTSTPCSASGACTFEAIIAQRSMFAVEGDESCESWHATNAPSEAYLCADAGHVIRHHVTTPMMVRMGLLDQLIGGNFVELAVSIPGIGAVTPARFATLVHDQLVELANLRTLAEEGAAITKEPATFGPPCPDHETLSTNPSVFDVSVLGPGGVDRTMLEVMGIWRVGGQPSHVVWEPGTPVDCGEEQ